MGTKRESFLCENGERKEGRRAAWWAVESLWGHRWWTERLEGRTDRRSSLRKGPLCVSEGTSNDISLLSNIDSKVGKSSQLGIKSSPNSSLLEGGLWLAGSLGDGF